MIIDVMMPEIDGYQTIKVIRNDPRFRSLPIIAITAKALKEDRDRCLAAGASDYLLQARRPREPSLGDSTLDPSMSARPMTPHPFPTPSKTAISGVMERPSPSLCPRSSWSTTYRPISWR